MVVFWMVHVPDGTQAQLWHKLKVLVPISMPVSPPLPSPLFASLKKEMIHLTAHPRSPSLPSALGCSTSTHCTFSVGGVTTPETWTTQEAGASESAPQGPDSHTENKDVACWVTFLSGAVNHVILQPVEFSFSSK